MKNTKEIMAVTRLYIQGVPKKRYPLKSSASAACSNLKALSPQ